MLLTRVLVGSWRFENTALDLSGNGQHGTLHNGAAYAAGKFGRCLLFDGIDDYAEFANTVGLNPYPITLSAWAKSDGSASNYSGLVAKYPAGSLNGWMLYALDDQFHAAYIRDVANLVHSEATAGFGAMGAAWTHLVFTVDAGGLHLYRDGVFVRTVAWTGAAGPSTQAALLEMGRITDGIIEWDGLLDEVHLWDRVLIATDIRRVMMGMSPVG